MSITGVAVRMDFVARADEITAPLRLVLGAGDEACFRGPAAALGAATGALPVVVDAMAHALADEPGLEPAPQAPHAATVDAHAVDWFRRHLSG